MEEIYCGKCLKWEEFYFEEILTDKWIMGLLVKCKGCGLDISHKFMRQSAETLEKIRSDNIVRWITLNEKFSYWI